MAGRGAPLARPVWMKQAEEAKLKDEEQKAAAARAAFDATFKDVDMPDGTLVEEASSDSDTDEAQKLVNKLANKPIGPVEPAKCTAAGTGVGGGAAGAAASFVVVTKDSDGRRVSHGGAHIKVRITPGVGVGGVEQEAVVKDHGDGTYTVTYAVAKRGDYMVCVECNGQPILGSPFPVFFSGGLANGLLPSSGAILGPSPFGSGVGQSLTPFSGVVTGIFPGMLGMIPGLLPGATGGAVLPGLGASFGEVCRDYLNGRCARSDCKYNHPPQAQLMAALAAGSTMGGLSQMPMPPSAAAMAAAQSIAAAQAYQAAQARAAAQQQESTVSKEKEKEPPSPTDKQKEEALSRTLQVSNLSPMLTAEQLRQLFSYCGTVADCQIADSKQLAFVEYAKPEEAKAALALNNMEVGGRPLNVEMAKSIPTKKPSAVLSAPAANGLQPPPLPVMMQQAVAMQQLQFQQALLVQQAMASQQAAARAATVKSAAEMSVARAAEISKRLKVDGDDQEEKEASAGRSPARSHARSRSKSRSPIRYRRDRRSRSFSRSPIRYRRDRRSRSRSRDRHHHRSDRGRYYRSSREVYPRFHARRPWERDREREYDFRSFRRSRSRSRSKTRRRSRSRSPRYRKEQSCSPRPKREEQSSSQRPRSPAKEVCQSATHSGKAAERIDTGKEQICSPSLRKDEQASSQQVRHSTSPSKEMGPSTISIKNCGETTDSTRGQIDRQTVMTEDATVSKQPFADRHDVVDNLKASEDEDKGEEERKEKRRHKKRHKKDDDHDKREKKRKKHKHRRRRSPSDSQDDLPSLEDGKSKAASDDSALYKKSHKKKHRHSRSTSSSSGTSD